ncbi:hypothetical protein CKA32_001218 [Geitlerinema sp. FC II]|nr:hypothetical protein CKA32_001218 [Geitlerinema sp. FC II]
MKVSVEWSEGETQKNAKHSMKNSPQRHREHRDLTFNYH